MRDDGAFRADAASGKARRDLVEDLSGMRGGDDHLAPVARELQDRVGIGGGAGMRPRHFEELGGAGGGRYGRGGRARIEGARVRTQAGGERALVGIEQPGGLSHLGDGAQQLRDGGCHAADIARDDEARARRERPPR